MRILFVAPYVPSLTRVRTYNFIKRLSRNHQITLVALTQGDDAEGDALIEMNKYCERVLSIPIVKSKSYINCCRRLMTSMPLHAAYTDMPNARNLVWEVANRYHFDLVHVEHIRGAKLVDGLKGIPKIFDSVDCITLLLKARLAERKGMLRALELEELLKMRSYEPRTAAAFDKVVITSKHDKKALEMLMRRSAVGIKNGNGDAICVIPNGVDSEYFTPEVAIKSPSDSNEIAFCGRMSYFPNSSAVLDFYHTVFLPLSEKKPDLRFKIIGTDPPDEICKLAKDPNVEVTGFVPDIRPHLESASLVVCPLKIGVGIQNKVLEAMAMQKPVVASSTACKGIAGLKNGHHLIRADSAIEMSTAVLNLIENKQFGEFMGKSARSFVVQNYSWESAFHQLEDVYFQTIDQHYYVPAAA